MTYKNGVLYKGNIVKKINDNVVIVKERDIVRDIVVGKAVVIVVV